jgi:hypothetical protein
MTAGAGARALDWGALVALAVHPTKVGIAESLSVIGRPLSASEIQTIYGEPMSVGSVTYHMNELVRWGALEPAGKEPGTRGAPRQLFDFTDLVVIGG